MKITYNVGHDPTGSLTLQRLQNDRARVKLTAIRSTDAFIDHWRTDLTLAESPRATDEMERTAKITNVTPASLTLSIDGAQYLLVLDQIRSTGTLPVGTFPNSLFGAAVAALPDSLPDEVFIWFFDLRSGQATAQRLTFGRTDTLSVPLAQVNKDCEEGNNTIPTKLGVRMVTATLGAVRQEYPVLAKRPHLRVELSTTRCVRLPENGGSGGN